MERSRTPAGLSRASRWMFFSQATIDSVCFAGHITFAIIAEGKPSISLTAPAFLACAVFVYEAVSHSYFIFDSHLTFDFKQFSILIHQIQLPEDQVSAPPAPVPTPYDTLPTSTVPPPPPAATPPTLPDSPTFWAFAAHHLRTDPGARMCMPQPFAPLNTKLTFWQGLRCSPSWPLSFGLYCRLLYPSCLWQLRIRQYGYHRSYGQSAGVGLADLRKSMLLATLCVGCPWRCVRCSQILRGPCLLSFTDFLVCPSNVLEVEPRCR